MKHLNVLLERRQALVHIFFCILYLGSFFAVNWQTRGMTSMRALALFVIGAIGVGIAYHVYYLLVLAFRRKKLLRAIGYFLIGACVIAVGGFVLFVGSENRLSTQVVDHTATHTVPDYLRFFMLWYAQLGKFGLIFYFAEKPLFRMLDIRLARYWPTAIDLLVFNPLTPHFFKNIMHRVYNWLSIDKTLDAMQLAHLSNLVSYSMINHYASVRKLVPLADEMAAVHNLLSVEDGHNIHLQTSGDIDGIKVPPMLLLSIAKNMLKHGATLGGEEPAVLDIRVEGNALRVQSTNGLRETPRWSSHDGGQGLQYIRQLLKSVYGRHAALHTGTLSGCFYLILQINNLKLNNHEK